MKIRFGVSLGADIGPGELSDIVDQLEAAGIDSLWFSELVYAEAVDPFVGMSVALARTKRLKVVRPSVSIACRTRTLRGARRATRESVRRGAAITAHCAARR